MALLTDRTLATGVTLSDYIHVVIPSDISQNPAGSSYKATVSQVADVFSNLFVNQSGDTMTSDISQLVQDEKDKYLRLYSEFDNFRKRTAKDRLEWMQTASKDLIAILIFVKYPSIYCISTRYLL